MSVFKATILENLDDSNFEEYSVRGLLLNILLALTTPTGGGGGGPPRVRQIAITTIAATTNVPKVLGQAGALVYWAVVQNITTSDITFTVAPGAISPGFILNAAPKAGQAGDSFTFAPAGTTDAIDLSQIAFNYPGAGTVNAITLVALPFP